MSFLTFKAGCEAIWVKYSLFGIGEAAIPCSGKEKGHHDKADISASAESLERKGAFLEQHTLRDKCITHIISFHLPQPNEQAVRGPYCKPRKRDT